jgi:hypothetical protein
VVRDSAAKRLFSIWLIGVREAWRARFETGMPASRKPAGPTRYPLRVSPGNGAGRDSATGWWARVRGRWRPRRRDPHYVRAGDAPDCWRVESIEPGKRLRLAAEMKLPARA